MSELPAVMRQCAERAVGNARTDAGTVRVAQTGEMVMKPGASPRRFEATEEFAIDRVAFTWRARFPVLGPLAMRVTDSYDGQDGGLEVRLAGLPLQRKSGPELSQGQVYRYLAELPWVPHAILANHELEWQELDGGTVEVAAAVAGQRVALRLALNDAGEIVRTEAERPRLEAGNALTPWIGQFGDYHDFGGVRVPTRGEVLWGLPEGPFTYWRGRVTSLELG